MGATAVPAEWVAILHGWPGYTAEDLARLAVLAAKKGRVDNRDGPRRQDAEPVQAGWASRLGKLTDT